MNDRLFLGTRKGLFTLNRTANGWEVAKVDFLGDNVGLFLPDTRDGKWVSACDG